MCWRIGATIVMTMGEKKVLTTAVQSWTDGTVYARKKMMMLLNLRPPPFHGVDSWCLRRTGYKVVMEVNGWWRCW